MSNNKKIVKIGSRKSQLALIQTNSVKARLEVLFPEIEFQVITMETLGNDNLLFLFILIFWYSMLTLVVQFFPFSPQLLTTVKQFKTMTKHFICI